jgi:hypothetical protein
MRDKSESLDWMRRILEAVPASGDKSDPAVWFCHAVHASGEGFATPPCPRPPVARDSSPLATPLYATPLYPPDLRLPADPGSAVPRAYGALLSDSPAPSSAPRARSTEHEMQVKVGVSRSV